MHCYHRNLVKINLKHERNMYVQDKVNVKKNQCNCFLKTLKSVSFLVCSGMSLKKIAP